MQLKRCWERKTILMIKKRKRIMKMKKNRIEIKDLGQVEVEEIKTKILDKWEWGR